MLKLVAPTKDGKSVVILGLEKRNIEKMRDEDNPVWVKGKDLGLDHIDSIFISYKKPVTDQPSDKVISIVLDHKSIKKLKKDGLIIKSDKLDDSIDSIVLDYAPQLFVLFNKYQDANIIPKDTPMKYGRMI